MCICYNCKSSVNKEYKYCPSCGFNLGEVNYLYHYTSFEALCGIFQNNNNPLLKFHNIEQLDDPLERNYLYELFKMEDIVLKQMDDIYAFSLSSASDDLNMWKLYANKGTGVAIGFNKSKLFNTHQNPCRYDGTIKLKECRYITNNKSLPSDIKSIFNRKGHNDETIDIDVMDDFDDIAAIVKSSQYLIEQEWRLLFKSAKDNGANHHLTNENYKELCIRRDCIEEIILGPKCNISECVIKRIVGDDLKIIKSSLKYR